MNIPDLSLPGALPGLKTRHATLDDSRNALLGFLGPFRHFHVPNAELGELFTGVPQLPVRCRVELQEPCRLGINEQDTIRRLLEQRTPPQRFGMVRLLRLPVPGKVFDRIRESRSERAFAKVGYHHTEMPDVSALAVDVLKDHRKPGPLAFLVVGNPQAHRLGRNSDLAGPRLVHLLHGPAEELGSGGIVVNVQDVTIDHFDNALQEPGVVKKCTQADLAFP